MQPSIDQYMSKIHGIINQQKVSTRIKFMLQDVLELRNVRMMCSLLHQKKLVLGLLLPVLGATS